MPKITDDGSKVEPALVSVVSLQKDLEFAQKKCCQREEEILLANANDQVLGGVSSEQDCQVGECKMLQDEAQWVERNIYLGQKLKIELAC